ncbi:MAG TPA: hypothetical protein VD788_11330, partial [Candidatus Polarisedimenticolaceae bacterium]|nr:hypothetical protein [Candidatus Polarisedimenticolaceae bacterium]
AFGGEPCTVVQWSSWSDASAIAPFAMQALLYHDSLLIVFQIRPGDQTLAGGTTGIQQRDARSASRYPATDAGVGDDTAVCWFEPRYPAGPPAADLELINADKVDSVVAGHYVHYAVAVRNHGPAPAGAVDLHDVVPPTLENCRWFCSASAGSSCAAEGTGPIDESVAVAAGGWVGCDLHCRVATGSAASEIAHHAAAEISGPVADPLPANNSATDVNQLLAEPPECGSAAAAAVVDALGDPSDLVPRALHAGPGPLTVTVQRVFALDAEPAPASERLAASCAAAADGRPPPLGSGDRPAGQTAFQIEFTIEDGRGGVCSAIASVRGTSARGRFGLTPAAVSAGDACALP